MKRVYITTIVTALVVMLVFSFVYSVWDNQPEMTSLDVGFVYENDESAPYTYNFVLAQEALEEAYPERVHVTTMSNVLASEAAEPMREMARKGCGIVFTNCYTDQVRKVAREFPGVQFCQVSWTDPSVREAPENYHTFNGQIYQGFYISGIAAGMKLRDLIDRGVISPKQAKVGFVGTYVTTELCSNSVAFLLGVHSVAPEATMKVRCTHSLSSYSREMACARQLIEDGCIVISQHTHTIGPALACEQHTTGHKVYHCGFNQSMLDDAPTSSLISTRVNWTPYITGAVKAVLGHKPIEKCVDGFIHGNDISGGFEHDWIEMLELNKAVASEGTQQAIDRAIEAFRRGRLEVFKGDYVCVNPDDPDDTYDLNQGFPEGAKTSFPAFHYVLRDYMDVVR